MTTTIAVAMPASANAPDGPRLTTASTSASLASPVFLSEAFIAFLLFRKQFAQFVGLRRRHRRAAVFPGDPDVRHHRCHLIVVEDVRERRHAMRPRVLRRS